MDRRNFLKMGSVAAVTLPAVKSVEAVALGPKDVVVVSLESFITDNEMGILKRVLRESFPNNRGLILSPGMELKTVRTVKI